MTEHRPENALGHCFPRRAPRVPHSFAGGCGPFWHTRRQGRRRARAGVDQQGRGPAAAVPLTVATARRLATANSRSADRVNVECPADAVADGVPTSVDGSDVIVHRRTGEADEVRAGR